MKYFYHTDGGLLPLTEFTIKKGQQHHLQLPGSDGAIKTGGMLPDTFLIKSDVPITDTAMFHVMDDTGVFYVCTASTVSKMSSVFMYGGVIHQQFVPDDRDKWIEAGQSATK
jgi:hypothetical protein